MFGLTSDEAQSRLQRSGHSLRGAGASAFMALSSERMAHGGISRRRTDHRDIGHARIKARAMR